MFMQKGMVEAQNGEIIIVDSSPEVFRSMLEFFYSGEIDEDSFEKLDDDLYAIAHKYQVKELKKKCENFMCLTIDYSNFIKRYQCAEMYGLSMLEKACAKFIYDNRKNFFKSKEWEEFKNTNGSAYPYLIQLALQGCSSSDSIWNDNDADSSSFDNNAFSKFGFNE
ncbi:hypothetical protein ACQ4LE_004501 [Meloidogyne hapla]